MSPKQEEKRGFDLEVELEMQEMGRSGEVSSETPMKLAQRSVCEAQGRGLRLSPTACGKLCSECVCPTRGPGARGGVCRDSSPSGFVWILDTW